MDHNKLWKILKEVGIPDHLTWLLRNLYPGQEAMTGTGHGTVDWFYIGKRVCQGCILSPCLFFLNLFFIEGKLPYRILLFSVKPQHESAFSSVQSLSHVRHFATP